MEVAAPIGHQDYAGEMRARGMASYIKAVAIAAEGFRVLVHPCDSASHLIGHHHEIAADVVYRGKVKDDVMGSGVDKNLGWESKVFCPSVAPGAAVKAAGKPVQLIVGEGFNHFEMQETFGNPYGLAGRAALELMNLQMRSS